jgi:hypothetical protein
LENLGNEDGVRGRVGTSESGEIAKKLFGPDTKPVVSEGSDRFERLGEGR